MELADNDNNSNSNSDANSSSAHSGALGQSTASVDGSDSSFFDAQQSITKDVSIAAASDTACFSLHASHCLPLRFDST
jgi:hypothetical protein